MYASLKVFQISEKKIKIPAKQSDSRIERLRINAKVAAEKLSKLRTAHWGAINSSKCWAL